MTAQHKILSIKGQVLFSDGDQVLLLMLEDVTLRREAEDLGAQQRAALEDEVQVAAHTLTRTKEELRGLTGHLFTVQEEEREHVARELHDDVSQRLSLVEILLAKIPADKRTTEAAESLESIRREVQTLNNDVRHISHRLHPAILKDLGLPAALKSLVEEFGRRESMPASFSVADMPPAWPEGAATAMYRITQEAMRNVLKHAGKTHLKVVLRGVNHSIELKVMDFGIGFDGDPKLHRDGLGMISMQERARLAGGTCLVESELGGGTTVTVRLPLE